MRDIPAEPLERLLAGELTRDEERNLAQAALSDPELFDALTAASVAKAALAPSKRPARASSALIAALAVAAALVIAVVYWQRGERASPAPTPTPAAAATTASTPAAIAPPILLTARVEAGAAPTFRTEASPSRTPKEAGTIVAVRDETADLDLGSLDGLKQGDAVWIVRGQQRLGRITVTTVFRDRARGRADAGAAMQAGDRIEVDPVVHVNALLELAAARRAAGDLTAAREFAATAATRAQGPDVSSDVRQKSRIELGTILNELGAVQIEQREFPAAEQSLRSAQSVATGGLLARVTNNLGALAALRGDRVEAERLYREADALAAGAPEHAPDRQAIAKNLAALHASR